MEMPKRNIYLKMKTLSEALEIWSSKTGTMRTDEEIIPVTAGLGRVTFAPITARRSVPHYHGAAMDGFAVAARNTFGASDTNRLQLDIRTQAFAVDTGDPLPPGTDAVIMIEQVEQVSDKTIEIRSAAFPWQHVRKVGEDIIAGELLLPRLHVLRPADLGALLAAGAAEVSVFARPRVWVQPTGSELISASRAAVAEPGQIIEFNGTILSAMVAECHGIPDLREIVEDDYECIKRSLQDAIESQSDIILINAGSSAGSEDYTSAVIADLGEVFVHGVAMMPGKPVILGMAGGKPIVGLPGYPVSAIMAFEQFVRPLLFSMQSMDFPEFESISASLGRKMPSKLGLEEFARVILGRVEGKVVATPIQRGAGIITSLTRADGILQIPQEQEGIEEGADVRIRLLRPRNQIDFTLVMIGSHDNAIDLIANEIRARDGRIRLSSSNVGSLGGLMAIRRSLAHFAGSHLLDTETGEYNYAYIERYLKGKAVRLVKLAMREQGLLVRKGNPRNITGIDDLISPDVSFINRQAGAGTRVLFDYLLQQRGISPESVKGYDQEEFTHMAIAVSVLSGRADAGMAIYSSARALNLDFIPVGRERYDLIIPESAWDDFKTCCLMDVIVSDEFRRLLTSMGGYDPTESGRVMGIWNGYEWTERQV